MSKLLGHRVFGAGKKTVIFLHEWLGDHNNWRPMLPYLPEGKARWVAADFRGYGWSQRLKGDFTLEEATDDVLALADHLGGGKVHLVGHSMGGLVAQAVAALKPSRVSSLILVCPVPANGFRADEATLARMKGVLKGGKALQDAIHDRTGHRLGDGLANAKARIARRAVSPEVKEAYLQLFTQSDISDQVAGLKMPVRLIAGKYDLPFYRMAAQKRRFAKWYPHLDGVEIAEAGHYPPLETPARLAGLIEEMVIPSSRKS